MKTPAELRAIADKIRAEKEAEFRNQLLPYIAEIHRELGYAADIGNTRIDYRAVNTVVAQALADHFTSLGFETYWYKDGDSTQILVGIGF